MKFVVFFIGFLPALLLPAFAEARPTAKSFSNADLAQQYRVSIAQILNNLPQNPSQLGAVAASPTAQYQFHWTRDAALTWQALLLVHQTSPQRQLRQELLERFRAWVQFETRAVQNAVQAGLTRGEPKYHLDGRPYTGPWGRPQNDGPALRALVMSQWAFELLKSGQAEYVRSQLFQGVIRADLEYTANTWEQASFDPWEEVKGLNYYNLVMKRKALLIGAELARALGETRVHQRFQQQAQNILNLLPQFSDAERGYVISVIRQVDGWNHKNSKLDVAAVLATIHGPFDQIYLQSQFQFINRTVSELEHVFSRLYPINQQIQRAPAIGRYPEDVYDGFGFSGGNPWFLATHAHAEYHCRLAREIPAKFILNRNLLMQRGRDFLFRSLTHRNQQTGEMSEQISRKNGFLTGVSHLTWSYASYITAARACGVAP